MADGGDRLVERRTGKIEGERHFARFAFFFHGRIEGADHAAFAAVAEGDAIALLDALARSGEGFPAAGADAHVQRCRDLLAAGASRWRMPSSWAGMTFVSLNTSASPARRNDGRWETR